MLKFHSYLVDVEAHATREPTVFRVSVTLLSPQLQCPLKLFHRWETLRHTAILFVRTFSERQVVSTLEVKHPTITSTKRLPARRFVFCYKSAHRSLEQFVTHFKSELSTLCEKVKQLALLRRELCFLVLLKTVG